MSLVGKRLEDPLGQVKKVHRQLETLLKEAIEKKTKIESETGSVLPTDPPIKNGAEETAELLKQLELASAKKNYYILMARTAQVNDELSGEIDRLVEDNCRREMELEQPISLTLTAPTAEQKVKIGSSLTVEWAYTGPIGEKLRITLLKSDAVSRIIAQNIDKTDLTFTWDVSERILPSDNYQVVVLDPMSGRSVKSDKFKITKE